MGAERHSAKGRRSVYREDASKLSQLVWAFDNVAFAMTPVDWFTFGVRAASICPQFDAGRRRWTAGCQVAAFMARSYKTRWN
jgi:hypothetical protein